MFKDQEEALRRLEEELLREDKEPEEEPEEDWEDEPEEWDDSSEEWDDDGSGDWEAEAHRHPDLHAYNTDRLDRDLDSFSQQVYDSERKLRGRWTAAAALIVLAGLLLVLAFLAAKYMGRQL